MAQVPASEKDLEDLLQKATDPNTEVADELAINLFCSIIRQDPKLVRKSTEMLVTKIKSNNVTQSRKGLELLEECMSKCGQEFQVTVARFQFLNELIRLVSEKFSGRETSTEIRNKILDCLSLWTVQYPERTKIKDAYDTLLRSGVVHKVVPTVAATCRRTTFMDDENEKKLKKLLQSTNREDLQRANLLIQYLVKQDAKKCELISRQKIELQEAKNSATLLNQVLDRLIEDGDRVDGDYELGNLVKELHTMCLNSKPIVMRIPEIIDDDETLLGDAIEINDLLLMVMDKYEKVMSTEKVKTSPKSGQKTLDQIMLGLEQTISSSGKKSTNPLDDLCDIFNQSSPVKSNVDNMKLLEPISVPGNSASKVQITEEVKQQPEEKLNVFKTLSTIDKLSEDLFKESLNNSERVGTFNKAPQKIPIKDLIKDKPNKTSDIDSIIDGLKDTQLNSTNSKTDTANILLTDLVKTPSKSLTNSLEPIASTILLDNQIGSTMDDIFSLVDMNGTIQDEKGKGDGLDVTSLLQDLTDDLKMQLPSPKQNANESLATDDEEMIKINEEYTDVKASQTLISTEIIDSSKSNVKHLSEINVDLNNVRPSNELPRVVKEDLQGLRITFNFTLDQPSPNVSVIVISTINQSPAAIEDYHFDASVPKPCKVRLIPPIRNCLPGVKPFRPPTDSIQQILLLSNPTKQPLDITCIIGYRLGDDPDPIKESVIVKDIPYFD